MQHTLSMMSKPKRAIPVLTIYRGEGGKLKHKQHWCREAQAAHFTARLRMGKHFVAALPR